MAPRSARPGSGGLLDSESGFVLRVLAWLRFAIRCVGDWLAALQARKEPDEQTVFEQRSGVDQILFFFESEYEKYEGYVKDIEGLEKLRIEYYNFVDAIDFQNELIAGLVDDLLQLRMSFRTSSAAERKDISIKLAHTKLDLGERKSKRCSKEKERRLLHKTLSPMIAEIKMRRLEDEQAYSKKPLAEAGTERTQHFDSESCVEAQSGPRRRCRKLYSDAELTALLRERDS